MQALGKLQDPRAADVLAEKLADPALRGKAVDALRLMGPRAKRAVLDYAFDESPDTRLRASELLAEYGVKPGAIAGEALGRLKSNSPGPQRSAAAWFAENAPEGQAQQAEVARGLAELLADLSPKVDALALRGLKLWATRDCLPQVVAFARRQEKGGACTAELLDVLARFPDGSAAEAIARRLKDPANRARAVQALAKLGPSATGAVLGYINHPDADVRKEARGLCRLLKIPAGQQLDQTLADVADARQPRCRTALKELARLRPDEGSRAKVSQALNAPLLDADAGVRADALEAVRVWGTKENTATLVTALGKFQGVAGRDPCVIDVLGSLRDPAAAPALAEGLTNPREGDAVARALVAMGPGAEEAVIPYLESSAPAGRYGACWVLTQIGTDKSLPALKAAWRKWARDEELYWRTQVASEKIMARR
jgi:HEAT repeat protein